MRPNLQSLGGWWRSWDWLVYGQGRDGGLAGCAGCGDYEDCLSHVLVVGLYCTAYIVWWDRWWRRDQGTVFFCAGLC